MIKIILKDILAYKVQVPLLWLLGLLILIFKLGYQVSKRKYYRQNSQNLKVESIVPFKSDLQYTTSPCQKTDKNPSLDSNDCKLKPVQQNKEQLKEGTSHNQNMVSDLLKQKLNLQSKKLQSTSFLQIRIEPSNNLKYMRKIQKHELVTDYELQTQEHSSQIIPFKNSPNVMLSQPNSCLSVVARQDHTMKLISPISEQQFVKMNYFGDFMKNKEITSWLTETGKFNKFYRKTKVIGKGGFGCVFKAENIYDEKQYAIKKIIIDGTVKLNDLLRQVSIISKYNHPNIVFYYTCWIQLSNLDEINQISSYIQSKIKEKQSRTSKLESLNYVSQNSGFEFEKSETEKSKSKKSIKNSQIVLAKQPFQSNQIDLINIYTLHIQMELCEASLYEYLRNRKTIDYKQSFQILTQLLHGLQFLHSNGIVHRDLKPGNILMSKHKNQIKIGDFGLATLIESHSDHSGRNKVGTPLYMAPQLNSIVPVAKQDMHLVDIFSLGVIYYELLNEFSACTQHQRYQKIHSLQRNSVNFESKLLKEEKKFIKLLTKNSNTRPSIVEVMQSTQFAVLKRKYET